MTCKQIKFKLSDTDWVIKCRYHGQSKRRFSTYRECKEYWAEHLEKVAAQEKLLAQNTAEVARKFPQLFS